MRRLLLLATTAIAGTIVPFAAALDPPAIPTVSTPTVSVPSLPVPTPTVPAPTVPAPTLPAPTVPAPTVPTPTVPTPTVPPVPTPPLPAAPPPSAPAAGSGGSPGFAAPGRSSHGSTSARPRSQRTRQRPVVVHFRLPRAGTVRIVVRQQAPRCRLLGRYVVHAARGGNLLRLRRKVGSHRLRPGTYRFVGTARGREVLDRRVRVVRRDDGTLRVLRDHLADVCAAGATTEAVGPAAPFAPGRSASGPGAGHARPPASASSGGGPAAERSPGDLRPPFLHLPGAAGASPLLRAILYALLGAAIALLATGSLPERIVPAAPVAGTVARHRAAITLGGLALLVTAALVILLA